MTGAELAALIGIGFGVVTLIGGIVVRDRQVHKAIKDGDDQLHERVNRVRDEYVRRVDLDTHMGQINSTLQEIRQEQRDLMKMFMQFMSHEKSPKS